MATAVTPTALVKDTASADLPVTAGTAFTDASELTIAYPIEGKLLVVINNTYAGAAVATIAAGGYLAAGIGALAITLAQDDVKFVLLSSDRFKAQGTGTQATAADGKITITFSASATGFVQAFSMPY